MIRPSSPAGFDPPGSTRRIDRVSSARPQDSAAEAQRQRLPVAVQTGRMRGGPVVMTELSRAGLDRADGTPDSPPQFSAQGRLAAAQYQTVASLEQRTALVEMMGIDTFA